MRLLRAILVISLVVVCLFLVVGPSALALQRQQLLLHAVARGDVGIMRMLLSVGADPNSNAGGGFPLYAATWAGQVDAATLLLSRGASVDAREASGATALMCAATRGDDNMVRLLLAHGASVTASMSCGTALDIAVVNHHLSTEKILLAAMRH